MPQSAGDGMPKKKLARMLSVVPGEGGHFKIVEEGGMSITEGADIRSIREVTRTIDGIAKADGYQAEHVYDATGNYVRSILTPGRVDHPFPRVNLKLEIGADLDAMMEEMAEDLGVPKGSLILKAIGLLKLAVDARSEGKTIGIIDVDGELDQEIEL